MPVRDFDDQTDIIIVGGGTAGCVLASRLSETPTTRILLIEAGNGSRDASEPPEIADARLRTFFRPELFWPGMTAKLLTGVNGARDTRLFQARVLGGGASVNGMHAQRGFPEDYDGWSDLVSGWSWQHVLPYFIKLENSDTTRGPAHGNEGPIRLHQVPREQWSKLSLAIADAFAARNVPYSEDTNTDTGPSYGPLQLNMHGSQRVSAASGYLTAAVRARSNLRILSETEVSRLIVEHRRVLGVEARSRSGVVKISARHTVVCAGGLLSPSLLLRSGIGPAADLHARGIEVIADRRGVGRNLQTHPMFNLTVTLRGRGRQTGQCIPASTMIARYSSGISGCQHSDMILNVWERVTAPNARHPLGTWLANLQVIVNKPTSVGAVRLGNDAAITPSVQLDFCSDPRDVERLVSGVRLVHSILSEAPLRKLTNETLWVRPTRAYGLLMQPGRLAELLSIAGTPVMAGPRPLRRAILSRFGVLLTKDMVTSNELDQLVKLGMVMASHFVGTCRLGRVDDPDAVVDEKCQVIGVEGLSVVDASIFPSLMRAGTSLPVIMAAEKAADILRHA